MKKKRGDKQKSSLQKEERMQARKDPYRIKERDRDREKVCICMYVCVCLTDVFHHCKEKNNNMSTTNTRKKKKRKDNKQNWQYQTYKKICPPA